MSVNGATGVVITNPLVKYRALVATHTIRPDPAQHRLAIRLQDLYERLKDYEPQIEYSHKLDQISRATGRRHAPDVEPLVPPRRRSWRSLLSSKESRDGLALTRRLTSYESAQQLQSPRGFMLHGEVGTGKSMLVDLFAECLPTRKKRRWHFNTFMLETFAKLESYRRMRSVNPPSSSAFATDEDYALPWLAKGMIETSPILFLDEFQLPDRAASKIMTNLMTSFFHLGGVLIATSNRMPEELAKAAGMEFSPPQSGWNLLGTQLGLGGGRRTSSDKMFAGNNEFAGFLNVLNARCEVWEMGSANDYRRAESGSVPSVGVTDLNAEIGRGTGLDSEDATSPVEDTQEASVQSLSAPANYLITTESGPADLEETLKTSIGTSSLENIAWSPASLKVYGRLVSVPRTREGTAWFTFEELCKRSLGPADYISLTSSYHTLILTDVPVLTWLMKNEARRFITLLDALYECRCKLLVTAEAGPDAIFFPERMGSNNEANDAVHSETFSEAYQDATAPFRPNILSQNPNYAEPDAGPDYTHARLQGILNADALEDDPPNKPRRSAFARSFGRTDPASERGPVDPDEVRRSSPNFSRTTAFTGEDERFAYKRAQSRLWELCGRKWWSRSEPGWHHPLPQDVRRWERSVEQVTDSLAPGCEIDSAETEISMGDSTPDDTRDARSFKPIPSPFRTSREPPPEFNWTHMWSMAKWGPRAGTWGKGVDGLKDRTRSKNPGD